MANLNNMPLEYRSEDRWVVWKRNKDGEKPPYKLIRTAYTKKLRLAGNASNKEPKDWTDFATAVEAVETGVADGIGSPVKEGHVFIDLDHAIVDGKVNSEAQAIIERLDSYSEISQSKTGAHIVAAGVKPTEKCRKGGVEIYDHQFIYFTGDVIDGRKTINERQEALDWLCQETFGGQPDAEPVPVDELVLDRKARPPADKLDALLKDRLFAQTWKHQREDFDSLSEYDMSLAGFAIRSGWSDRETHSLLIAFRHKWGDEDSQEKSVRPDYIKRTLAKVKPEADTTDVLDLLPFKVVKVEQRGVGESTPVKLILDDGQKIEFDSTEMLLSKTRARARLWQYDYDLPKKAEDRWREITKALIVLKERIAVVTRAEAMRTCIDDFISTRISLPMIERDGSISDMFGSGLNSIAVDTKGRLYLRLSDFARFVRVHTGMGGVTQKSVCNDLIDLGFKKERKVSVTGKGGKREQISLWVSPPKLVEPVGESKL